MHYRADCSMDGLYSAAKHRRKGRTTCTSAATRPGPLVLQILYIDPAGAPLSDDAPDPGCGFA